MALAFSILPIILTIICGHVLVRTGMLPLDNWGGIETLSYRLLIPVILIKSIAFSDLALSEFGPMVFAITFTLVFAGLITLAFRWLRSEADLPNATLSTLFQTTTRWNAFIALAAAELFIGTNGLALIALAMAALIPLINIVNIIVLATFGTAKTNMRGITLLVLKNPLVQACLIGIAINLSGITLPVPAVQTLDLIGRAALGVGLLAVGAGIEPARLFKISPVLWLGVVLRLILCPALFLAAAQYLDLGQTETLAGILVLAVPAASNGYIAAKQMGGNAELYADILAWQTLLSMFLLPLLAVFLTGY